MPSKYPLKCVVCEHTYSTKQSYSHHKRVFDEDSICLRNAKKAATVCNVTGESSTKCQNNTLSHMEHCEINITNNMTNHEASEALRAELLAFMKDIKDNSERQLKLVIDLLEERGVFGREKTDAYIRDKAFAFSDFTNAYKKWNEQGEHAVLSKVIKQVQHITPSKTAKVAPLRLLYTRIFEAIEGRDIQFEDIHRRPFFMNDTQGNRCDVLSYRDPSDDMMVMGWESKYWHSLLGDILFQLGNILHEKLKNLSYLTDEEEERFKKQKQINVVLDDESNQFYETPEAEAEDKRKMAIKKQKAEKKRAQQQERFDADLQKRKEHPFVRWWKNVTCAELLQDDPDVMKLIHAITTRLIRECKNDVSIGWHRLISYCRILHDKESFKPVISKDTLKAKEYSEKYQFWDKQRTLPTEEFQEKYNLNDREVDAERNAILSQLWLDANKIKTTKKTKTDSVLLDQ